jgi:hypothetical protein
LSRFHAGLGTAQSLPERIVRAAAAGLGGLDLPGIKLAEPSTEGADLSNANLERATLAAGNVAGLDLSGATLNGAWIAAANMSGASLRGARTGAAKISATNLEDADLTVADLTESRWFGVNVAGAGLSGAKTSGARASGVAWSQAKVPPAEIPEPIAVPPWLPALVAGIAVVFVAGIILAMRRRRAQTGPLTSGHQDREASHRPRSQLPTGCERGRAARLERDGGGSKA